MYFSVTSGLYSPFSDSKRILKKTLKNFSSPMLVDLHWENGDHLPGLEHSCVTLELPAAHPTSFLPVMKLQGANARQGHRIFQLLLELLLNQLCS